MEKKKKVEPIIYGLANEDYHHSEPYTEYLSSSQLKHYATSPRAAKYAIEHPTAQTEAMRFGSLFHMAMELYKEHGTIDAFYDAVAIFTPPINPKTEQPYGASTKAYAEAYTQFLADNNGKEICTAEIASQIDDMVGCAVNPSIGGSTAVQVQKLMEWGKTEVSHFIEYEGCKFKWRPDLETKRKIVDFKTVATSDLSEKSINNIIAKNGYDISAAFYLFMEHEQNGIWKTFYWLFVSKTPPYDAILVDASKWTYDYDSILDIVMPQVGAHKMRRLLDLHIKCKKENQYPGSEIFIPADDFGRRIMVANPPAWEINNAANIIEQTYQ